MTEKRFTIADYNQFYDNGKLITTVEVGELLNELWEELVELKNKQIKSIGENEQLKGRLETYRVGCREIYDDKCKLEKENEQLKEQLRNLRRLVNEAYMEGSE